VRPQSKIDPEEVRARAKQVVQDQRRLKVGFSIPICESEHIIESFRVNRKCCVE